MYNHSYTSAQQTEEDADAIPAMKDDDRDEARSCK